MATTTQTCGKATVRYDADKCSYTCYCAPGSPCTWKIQCGSIVTSGTGLVSEPHKFPQVAIAGNLKACAQSLGQMWKRKVIVPERLRGKRIRKRTLKGTPEEIAEALGFKLGPKRKA
jgi:hypothetical protein